MTERVSNEAPESLYRLQDLLVARRDESGGATAAFFSAAPARLLWLRADLAVLSWPSSPSAILGLHNARPLGLA